MVLETDTESSGSIVDADKGLIIEFDVWIKPVTLGNTDYQNSPQDFIVVLRI